MLVRRVRGLDQSGARAIDRADGRVACGCDYIIRVHFAAVVELDARAQVGCPHLLIGRDFPALHQIRDRIEVFIEIDEPALNQQCIVVLKRAEEVRVYPYLDRQITPDELMANAQHNDWLLLASDNIVPAEIINASPGLKGIGTVSRTGLYIDMAAAPARMLPVIYLRPGRSGGRGRRLRSPRWRKPGHPPIDGGNAHQPGVPTGRGRSVHARRAFQARAGLGVDGHRLPG